MGKGKYQSNNQANWPLIILFIVILAVIAVLTVLLLKSCGTEPPDAGATKPAITEPIQETTAPVETQPEETEPPLTEPTEPEPTETEPEPTETEPEPTETEPESTEPEPTEPEETEPAAPVETGAALSKGQEVAAMAESLEGKPEKSEAYPDGFDVGSFISYCFHKCGLTDVPRNFNGLLRYGKEVEEYRPGDVVVFHITPAEGEPYDYIGIVVEGDQFMAVSSSSEMVIKRPLYTFSSYPCVYRRFTDTQIQ